MHVILVFSSYVKKKLLKYYSFILCLSNCIY